MKFELRLTDDTNAYIVKNLWPLYVHEIAAHSETVPNKHGVLLNDDSVADLGSQGETQKAWWKNSSTLFPYLILADGIPAGFNFIATKPYTPEGVDVDFVVYEFFVLHAFRGQGVAERAVCEGLDRHRGRWEVVTHPTNTRAIAFWRRTLGSYTSGKCNEREGDHSWGHKVIFTFENSGKSPS